MAAKSKIVQVDVLADEAPIVIVHRDTGDERFKCRSYPISPDASTESKLARLKRGNTMQVTLIEKIYLVNR